MFTIKKILSPFLLRNLSLAFLLLLSVTGFAADDFPAKATRIVSDYTNTLRPDELQSLENKLVAFDDTTSMQIAVVMMSSVGNYDISDYSTQLFNKWKIGDQSKNSGVLLLVAKDDRKVWITTGYGMEGVFPDALVKQVIDREIVPRFRSGDYFGGIDAGTSAITKIVTGEYKASKKKSKDGGGLFPFLMFGFIVFVIILSQIGRAKRYGRKNNLGFWAAWALLNAASNRSNGSWGGFSGGGGFGGGGGGGGFGGFGGGMSGGGGAGGSW